MRTRQGMVLGGIVAVMVLLLACTETTVNPSGVAMPVMTSSALQPTLDALQVERYAQAIAAEQQQRAAQATLAVFYAAQTATAEGARATATAISAQATAMAEAQRAQSTATAWQTTVQAQQAQATATVAALQAQATATARAQEIQAAGTAQAGQATATAAAVLFSQEATATTQALQALSTVQAAEAAQEVLALRREAMINDVRAWVPWVLGIAGVVLVLWGFYRLIRAAEQRARFVTVKPDEREVILLDGAAVQPDRSFVPVLSYATPQQALPTPDDQRETTQRAQAVALIRASGGNPRAVAETAQPRVPGLAPVREFRTLRHATEAGILPPPLAEAIEAKWHVLTTGGNDGR